MASSLSVLQASVERLNKIVAPLSDEQIVAGAYPTEWSIAQTLSHLGSGAVIFRRNLEESLSGGTTPDGFNPSVWDEWNAKSPRAQVDDALEADAALLARYLELTDEERDSLSFPFGPMTVDFTTAVGLRLNEHSLHSWDVEVVLDPTAVLAEAAAAEIIDSVPMIAGFAGRPSGDPTTFIVTTTTPDRSFRVDLTEDGAVLTSLDANEPAPDADLTLPTEALIRLVYGRLDADHTPPFTGDAAVLDRLRRTFPGL
jgi:uncharacterized protein (TIGR03083 family)